MADLAGGQRPVVHANLVDEALSIRRKALGDKHPQVFGTLTVKAYWLLSTGHYLDAYVMAEQARAATGVEDLTVLADRGYF